jgi:hypothetical protein
MASYLNYTTWVSTVANLMGNTPTTDPNLVQILPGAIADGEQRIYRDLDLLNTVVRDQSANLLPNSRTFTLPQSLGQFVVTNGINVFTPVSALTNRMQLVPVTRDFLDLVWPNETAAQTPSVPHFYAMITDQIIIVGPPPDAAYTVEVIGTIRPTALSATNTTTYLTNVLPDLFLCATMIFLSGYQGNFSSMSDNPQQSVSWESHYKELMPSANTEENRKKYASQASTSMQPAPFATPARV